MLRGEGPQAASNDRDGAEFGPRCVHHIGGGGALLAQKSVLTISTLQIVLCAGYGDLHCFPGQRKVLSEPHSTGARQRVSSWGIAAAFLPLLPHFLGARRGVAAAGSRAHGAPGEAEVQDRVPGTQRSKQPSWKLSPQLERGSASAVFPGCDLG